MRRLEVDAISIVVVLASFAVFAIAGVILVRTLADAAEAHRGLCAIRADKEAHLTNSERFLSLTVPERIEKYGEALGRIPESLIESNVRQDRQTIDSLSFLECG